MEESPGPLKIGELLVKSGVLTSEQLENRLELARVIGQPLGQILLESGDLTKYELVCAIQIQSMILDGVLPVESGVASLKAICRDERDFKEACDASASAAPTCRLGELLLGAQIVSPSQLIDAISAGFQTSMPLGQTLVHARVVRPDLVAAALSLQRKIRAGQLSRDDAMQELRRVTASAPHQAPSGRVAGPCSTDRTPLLVDENNDPAERVRHFISQKIQRSRFDSSTISVRQLEADDLVGKRVGDRYDVLSVIGGGGMSFVYQVRDTSSDKLLALKMMQPRHRGDEEIILRFEQEAKAVASLSHPNVVAVHDYGVTHEGRMYFVMDYLEGISLAEVLDRQKGLGLRRSLPVWAATCSAVGHAHGKGIIHRDLKPSNIMLVTEGGREDVVKIVDFGIAKVLPQPGQEELRITRSGQLFGSPPYMSPEHCLGKQLDARSDIYSMGCVMYETLTGHPPFVGATAYDIFFKHMHSKPEPLSNVIDEGDLCERIEAIILKCMAKSPENRYQSMNELRDSLDELAQIVAAAND